MGPVPRRPMADAPGLQARARPGTGDHRQQAQVSDGSAKNAQITRMCAHHGRGRLLPPPFTPAGLCAGGRSQQ